MSKDLTLPYLDMWGYLNSNLTEDAQRRICKKYEIVQRKITFGIDIKSNKLINMPKPRFNS